MPLRWIRLQLVHVVCFFLFDMRDPLQVRYGSDMMFL